MQRYFSCAANFFRRRNTSFREKKKVVNPAFVLFLFLAGQRVINLSYYDYYGLVTMGLIKFAER